ncbi:MAG TPA: hypothetical protein VG936_05815 [Lacunisphaera sp.]|nr:hypothetical protein [Lacunisphaera sp.]
MKTLKTFLSLVIATACLARVGASGSPAPAAYRLETSAFVFKQSDFPSATIPAPAAADAPAAVVVPSPGTVAFEGDTLALHGAEFSWSGGKPPRAFSPIGIPAIIAKAGEPAEIRSAATIQYLEKEADGSLRVRDIDRDSPEAPHCQLKVTVAALAVADGDLHVACDLDLTTLAGREKIPGVNLDVGRPLLAGFKDQLELTMRPGEWTAVRLQAVPDGDERLLLLMKVVAAAETEVGRADKIETVRDLTLFMTYYYRQPRPELVGEALRVLGRGELMNIGDRYGVGHLVRRGFLVGFFAEVFAANPSRLPAWREIIDHRVDDSMARDCLREALKLNHPGAALESKTGYLSDGVLWGAFLASGNPVYLRKLVDAVAQVKTTKWGKYDGRARVMMLLVYNGPYHPLIQQTLDRAREGATPLGRELIDDLLHKDITAVQQIVRDMTSDSSFPTGTDFISTNPTGIRLPEPNTVRDAFGYPLYGH